MLCGVLFTPHAGGSSETQKRSLQLFTQWSPQFEFRVHYARGDGKDGIAIVDNDTAEADVEGINPWLPFFDFDVTPVVDIQAAIPLFQRAYEWRDSVA